MKFESARQRYDLVHGQARPSWAGIVEERVVGEEIRSPSVQLRITPLGQLEVLSTHDQVLGGPERAELPRAAGFPRTPGTRRSSRGTR